MSSPCSSSTHLVLVSSDHKEEKDYSAAFADLASKCGVCAPPTMCAFIGIPAPLLEYNSQYRTAKKAKPSSLSLFKKRFCALKHRRLTSLSIRKPSATCLREHIQEEKV
ncbi:hypothetical protein EW145_g6369 [Phellinidium pouzarii]|uniref:Uncharacterized protein n=1 Tax=Phellinidium pouzarii TaxID=167371 RepID=A0A4S4KWS9_9AGAM|nr:hypothetical protein EW145_g6369 [Phellinidium pouzarii]